MSVPSVVFVAGNDDGLREEAGERGEGELAYQFANAGRVRHRVVPTMAAA